MSEEYEKPRRPEESSEEPPAPPREVEPPPPEPPVPAPAGATRRFRPNLLYVFLIIFLLLIISRVFFPGGVEASYDEFLLHLRQGHVEKLVTGNDYHQGVMNIPEGWTPPAVAPLEPPAAGRPGAAQDRARKDGEATDGAEAKSDALLERFKVGGNLPKGGRFRFRVNAVRDGTHDLIAELEVANRKFGTKFAERESNEYWTLVLFIVGPFLILGLLWFFMMRQSGQFGRSALSFGKVKARLYADSQANVTFKDVAGCDEAKEELAEVVDYLRAPKKYTSLGGRMPRGVLLVGPPGTGKTLLARAVAGEARTPFFHLSGSDFVEMFVGVGAARVRDLFQQAKSRAPAIIFVDELDAVGRHRGAGLGGGHDEREQTLNQLLVEMDGFDTTTGIILLAATNRPDVLDPALLRPGRFDRQVVIDAPDAKGREAVLEVHARDKPFDDSTDFHELAAKTPGFTGADLANVINEAALLAARAGLKKITQRQLDEAVERVIAGPERRSRRLNDEERRRVAYHEAGHALVAALSKHADPVRKISIVPRGHAALGYTMQTPEEDRYLITESTLKDRLKGLLGGRAAEEIVFGETSTGAGSDLQRATQLARQMVCRFGMSEELGPITFGRESQYVFLGRDFAQEDRNYSERSAETIDAEVRRFIEEAAGAARHILEEHRLCLDNIAETLLEKEVMQGKELDELLRTELCRTREPELTPKSSAETPAS